MHAFRILVVAPLHASADVSTSTAWSAPIAFDKLGFDEAMRGVGPSLVVDLVDVSGDAKPRRVTLAFPAMRSFRPDVLLDDVAELRPAAAPHGHGGGGGKLIDDILDGMGSAGSAGAMPSSVSPLAHVVAHPEVRRIEAAWRGLHLLVARLDKDADVGVEAIHAEARDVDDVLDAVLRKTVGRYDVVVVVDHRVGATPEAMDRLDRWARRAEAMGTPLVANASPEVLGYDDLAALGRTQRRIRSGDDPRALALRNVATREVTRWVALAMNGAAARPRYDGPVLRHPEVTLREEQDLFVGPALLVASLAASSFTRTGWACGLTGPTFGMIRELPFAAASDAAGAATPLEAPATEEAAKEAAAAGIALFASAANADVAILPYAPTLFRGTSTQGGEAPAASHGLGDQLFVARLANVITDIAAAIPSDTPDAAAREVATITLGELFASVPKRPDIEVAVGGVPRVLEVTVRPRGSFGVRLDEVTLGAPLGAA